MSWNLLPLTGTHRGQPIPLRHLPFAIGRAEGCQLRPRSPAVGDRHCTLYVHEGSLAVEDNGSAEGTYLDGVPVTGPLYISPSSVLQVGPIFLKCVHHEPAAPVDVEQAAAALLRDG